MVHFTSNSEERIKLFESRDIGINQFGYDTLDDIINYKAIHTQKYKNQIFILGKFQNDQYKLFKNYEEKDNNVKDILKESDYMIWISKKSKI